MDTRSAYSHQSMAMSQDKEYAQAQIDAAGNTAEFTKGGNAHPQLTEWSMVAEKLAENTEEVRALKVVMIAANSKKGSKKPEWKPVLRPIGVLSDLLKKKRYENHFKLRDRMLPHLRKGPAPEPEQAPAKEDAQWDRSTSFRKRR